MMENNCDNCRWIDCPDTTRAYCEIKNFCYWRPKNLSGGINKEPEETGTTETAFHYQVSDKQPIEIMQDYLPHEQFIGFLRANVIKYSLRMGRKDDTVKDALKCWQYADWLSKALKGEKIVPGGKK